MSKYKYTIKDYLKTLKKINACPYCGHEVQIEPHPGCCGEVHSEQAYLDEDGGYIFTEEEIRTYFEDWKAKQIEIDEEEHENREPRADLQYDSWKDDQVSND